MSKGKYTAQDFQAWFQRKSYERFDGRELVVGVDCAKTAFYAAPMASGWQDFDVLYFERNDIEVFVTQLAALDFEQITILVEPTGTYSDPLVDRARKAGLNVVRINGHKTSKAKELFDSSPTMHDGKAAYTLGRLYQCGVGTEWQAKSEAERNLRALDTQKCQIDKIAGQLVGPLEAHLARHWPELTDYLGLKSATLLELLKAYGTAQAVAANKHQAEELMQKVGGYQLSQDKIEAVLQSAEDTVGVPPTVHQRELLQYFASMLRTHQAQARRLQRHIEEVGANDRRTKDLAPEVGKATAVAFAARVGDFADYDTPASLVNGFGVDLCEDTTGQTREDKRHSHHHVHISKRADGRPRGLLYMYALRKLSPASTSYCPICEAWYHERLRRNGGIKSKGLVALMRKLVRGLFWVARGHTFDAQKLFNTKRLRRLGYLS